MFMIAESALALLLAAWGHTAWHRRAGRRALRDAMGRFTPRPGLGSYAEAAPRAYFGARKHPHAVLLLHGFTASAGSFKHLTPALERLGLPYYAPNLTGHGLADGALLEAARAEDWLRDAWQAYDLLAAVAEEVSIVGFSYGTLLACELAMHRPVRHLVLVAPYMVLKSAPQRKLRTALARPGRAWLAGRLKPYLGKPRRTGAGTASDLRDPGAAAGLFSYPVMPLSALVAMWRTPHAPAFERLRCDRLDLLYGEHDQTSDTPALIAQLQARGIPHGAHGFAGSGHNLLEDHDRDAAVAVIAGVLEGAPRLDARSS